MSADRAPSGAAPAIARRERQSRLRPLTVLLVAVAVLAGSCSTDPEGAAPSTSSGAGDRPATSVDGRADRQGVGGGAGPEAVEVARAGTYAVGSRQETYVDRSRPTDATSSTPRLPERTLPAVVYYPAEGPATSQTPVPDAPPVRRRWPLVVFSHGVTGNGPVYVNTLQVWASAGYVVLAPNYPLSSPKGVPGGTSTGDVAAQTRDITFLLDQVLAADRGPGPLAGMIAGDRIGLAGHSLGGITTLGATYQACCADPRVRAAAEFAGLFFTLEGSTDLAPASAGRPLLIIHGSKDGTVPYGVAPGVFERVAPPKFFITLPAEGHIVAYVQGVGAPAGKVVTEATLDFFDRYLKDDRRGLDRLRAVVAGVGPEVASLQESTS